MQPWFTMLHFLHLIHYSSAECYHSIRFEKDSRYYVVRLNKDLLDDWVITLISGRLKSKTEQSKSIAFTDFNDAFDQFCALIELRQKQANELKSIVCDNSILLHLLPFMVFAKTNNGVSVVPFVKKTSPRIRPNKKSVSILEGFIPVVPFQQLGLVF